MKTFLALLLPSLLSAPTLDLPVRWPVPAFAIRLSTQKASYYLLEGKTQADGTPHRSRLMTAAHRTLPLGSVRTLCRADRPGVCATVRITDRMGRHDPADRQWDLSSAVAHRLGMLRVGLVAVTVRKMP